MTDQQLQAYAGLGVAFVFSVVFLVLLVRAAKAKTAQNYKIMTIVGVGMLAAVVLVGNTPYLSVVQNVVISLGCMWALYVHLTKNDNPSPKIVAMLVVAMLTCLLINQASRSFNIGLLKWFNVDVREQSSNPHAAGSAEDQIQSIVADQSRLNSQVSKLEDQVASISARIATGGAAYQASGAPSTGTSERSENASENVSGGPVLSGPSSASAKDQAKDRPSSVTQRQNRGYPVQRDIPAGATVTLLEDRTTAAYNWRKGTKEEYGELNIADNKTGTPIYSFYPRIGGVIDFQLPRPTGGVDNVRIICLQLGSDKATLRIFCGPATE